MAEWIELNGASFRYAMSGEGAPLVFLHEMGGTLESWDGLLPLLARSSRSTLRYDWRGCGASSKIRGNVTVEEMADDLLALLDALDIREPVTVIGCAVGAGIGLRFASRHQDRAKAVVAMAPAVGVSIDRRAATLERARLAEAEGMSPGVDDLLDATWPSALRGDPSPFASFRAKWLSNDPTSFAAINRMLVNMDFLPDLASIACPSLFMAGRYDGFRPPAVVSELAARVEGSRFAELESGHFMALQTPGLVAESINAFLTANRI